MNLEDMNPKGKAKLLNKIIKGLDWAQDNFDEEQIDQMLATLIPVLDEMDVYDGIGTEGWKENFDV